MATGGYDDSSFELYECQVCMTSMVQRNPRMLACHHSFCEDCLEKLLQNGEVSCPTCRKVTRPEKADVRKLPINFYLIKMFERETEREASRAETKLPDCQICGMAASERKCENCIKFLCGTCCRDHDGIPGYDKHTKYYVCGKHGDGITHVCGLCLKPVCMTCMVKDHKEHRNACIEYFLGEQKVKATLQELHTEVSKGLSKLTENLKKIVQTSTKADQMEADIYTLRQHYLSQLVELDKLQHILDTNKKERQDIIKTYEESVKFGNKTENAIGALMLAEGLALFEFADKKTEYETKLSKIEEVSRKIHKEPDIDIVQHMNKAYRRKDIMKLLNITPISSEMPRQDVVSCSIEKMEKILTVSREQGLTNTRVSGIAIVDQNSVVVAFESRNYVQQFTVTGEQGQKFFPLNKGKNIVDVATYNNYIFLLQPTEITMINLITNQAEVYKLNVKEAERMLTINLSNFIISERSGKVYRYNPKTDQASLVLERSPFQHMSMGITSQGTCFSIAQCMHTNDRTEVTLYDDKWNKLRSINIANIWPSKGSAIIKGDSLLVTHWVGNRICEYDLYGKHRRDLLTTSDGINLPYLIASTHQFLWILERNAPNHVSLKCYKLSY